MKIYDLAQPFVKEMGLYPGAEPPKINQIATVKDDGFNLMHIDITNHIGTHLDCPGHMIENGKWIHELPIERFTGTGTVIDCKGHEEITIDLLIDKLDSVDTVLFYSGFEELFFKEEFKSNYPVLTKEACDYLIEKKIKIVGVDYLSVDPINDEDFNVHKTLLGNDFILYECLGNLKGLINATFEFYGVPLNIKADGFPVRPIAIIK